MRRPLLTAVAVATLALTASACGNPAPGPGGVAGTVTVFAAASLTEVFTRIGEDFEAANPGIEVEFSFAGSAALAAQINEGAPADVFASAAPAPMKLVTDTDTDTDTEPRVFARNRLVIAVPEGNPNGVRALADLARPGMTVALCAERVPCGAAAAQALAAARVTVEPVTREQDVKAALTKVRLGEVDAALVYRTDARSAATDVDGVEFPESADAVNDYPIVVLTDAPNRETAQAFVAYVLSDQARRVLTGAGFQVP